MVQPAEEKVSLVFAAATLATVEGSLKLPVAHHLAIDTELQTDPLSNPNIPEEKWSDLSWMEIHQCFALTG